MQPWAFTGNLNVARSGHTATSLKNGTALVYGGYGDSREGGGYLRSAELYNPATGAWTLTGSTFYERSGHTATLLPSGKVLVVGGTVNTSTELYDPASGEWYATGKLIAARPFSHAATLLADGKVLVMGGGNGSLGFQNTAELYDPATGVWALTGSLFYYRFGHTETLLQNFHTLPVLQESRVLVAGGTSSNTAELYSSECELAPVLTGTVA